MIDQTIFEPKQLLVQPLQRVGYSDRTAWLMAAMSELAYLEFEDADWLAGLVGDLAQAIGKERSEVADALGSLLQPDQHKTVSVSGEERLKNILDSVGFDLLCTFDEAETQAFLAKRKSAEGEREMMILAFRGTEKKLKDWKTDLRIELKAIEGKKGRIHTGFQAAYEAVRNRIKTKIREHPGVPLFLTGHSLGGALAIVATRFLPADNLAACYTFGSPRVGDRELSRVFKTPIYRVVNASDGVPRVPTGSGMWFIGKGIDCVTYLLPRWRCLDSLRTYAEKITGYVHYGDMRYLTAAKPGPNHTYPDLMVISNPNLTERCRRLWKRVKDTSGQGLVKDHAVAIYRRKLRAYALSRNRTH